MFQLPTNIRSSQSEMEILRAITFLLAVFGLSLGLELDKISKATRRHARGLLDPLYKVKCGQACIGISIILI